MEETSLEAFESLRSHLGEHHHVLLAWFLANRHNPVYPPPWTGREIGRIMDLGSGRTIYGVRVGDPHKRLLEMKKGSLILRLPKRACRVTGCKAVEWSLPAVVPSVEEALKAKQRPPRKARPPVNPMQLPIPEDQRDNGDAQLLAWTIRELRKLKSGMLKAIAEGRFIATIAVIANALESRTIPDKRKK